MTGLTAMAPGLAAGALNSVLLGMAIAFAAQVLLWSVARRHSPTRFALLYSALIAIAAVFLFRSIIPHSGNAPAAELTLPAHWALYPVAIWTVIASLGLLRIAAGLWRLRTLRKNFVRLENPALKAILHSRARRSVALFTSGQVRVPAAFGFFRPAIVLPEWTVRTLSEEELTSAVLHELAHIDRWDDWTNLGQKIIRALLFFHPAVWWIDGRLAIEREMSCDDAVLAQSADPKGYAECLVSIAEKTLLHKQLALAHAAVGHMKQTALRIARILDGRQRHALSIWKPALTASAAFLILGAAALEHVPQLVSFRDSAGAPNAFVAENSLPVVARAVPASLMLDLPAKPARVHKARRSKPTGVRENRDYLARNKSEFAGPPLAVNASAVPQTSTHFMLVVFQTRQYDGSGTVTVTTTVWRVRVGSGAQAAGMAPLPHST